MTPHPRAPLRAALALLCLGLLAAGSSRAFAQNVFVCLGGKANLPSVVSIPAPGHGWEHSAVAPVPGTHWNRVRRTAGVEVTDHLLASGRPPARLGIHKIDTADSIPLLDPLGAPTSARLTIEVDVALFATDKPRFEPSTHNKSVGSTPAGLMDASWRVYLPDNRLVFSLVGLKPGRRYALYCYGAAATPADNATGDGEGARFTLEPANVAPGSSGTAETAGGYCGGIFTFSPETNRMTLSPEGSTWVRLDAVADADGAVRFSTTRNSRRRHFVNGFQLVETGG